LKNIDLRNMFFNVVINLSPLLSSNNENSSKIVGN